MTESSFRNLVRGKNVVFITVKNKSYIRVTQIKRLLEKEASSVEMYSSEKSNPITRTIDLKRRLKQIDLSKADVVVVGFLPQLLWKEVRSKTKAKLVAEMFLCLYDTVILDRKLFRDGWWIAGMLRRLDKQVIDSADIVITDTQANAEFIASVYGADKNKFETLYLEADREYYDAVEHEPKEEYQVLYFGTGLPLQGTDIVLDAFNKVTATNGNIKCVFVGKTRGVSNQILKAAADNPSVKLLKWLNQNNLAKKISESDLCIAGHFNLYIDKAARTIPGKAFIYDMMNKPMILGDTKANRELFTDDDRHIFVRRGDSEALAECIRKYLS